MICQAFFIPLRQNLPGPISGSRKQSEYKIWPHLLEHREYSLYLERESLIPYLDGTNTTVLNVLMFFNRWVSGGSSEMVKRLVSIVLGPFRIALFPDRHVPRRPRVGGQHKGHNIKDTTLPASPAF
jgi:hypothetical protein